MGNTLKFSVIAVAFITTSFVKADTLSFGEAWRKISESSLLQHGAKLKTQSAEEGLSRAEKHWMPRIYLDIRTYQTNDPGNAFFGLLEQKKVESKDFSPDALNHPNSQILTKGVLGFDLTLYEGGMKQAQVEMYSHKAEAEKLEASQIQIEQYAQSSLAYGSIASLQKQRTKLAQLNDEVTKLIQGYQLGQKSNPVGYSGLLGMKSLANRIGGLLDQLEAQQKSSYVILKEMGVKDVNWIPESFDARAFVARYLGLQKNIEEPQSYKVRAGVEAARASLQASTMEKSRYLPQVGAFAESYAFNGSRDTANGYMAGLYLRWSLFDPSDYGKFKEAQLASMAAEKLNEASAQQENAERESLFEMVQALLSNLARLDDSDKLLSEQTRVSSTLFRNGSINALQFVEILNRRTDLISQQLEAEIGLLKASVERVKKSKFEISESVNVGGRK